MKEALNKYTQAKSQVEARRQEVTCLEVTLAGQNQVFAATEQEVKAAIKQEIDARFASLTEADRVLSQNDPVKAYQLLFPEQVVSPGKYKAFAVLLDSSGSMNGINTPGNKGLFATVSEGAQEAFNFCTGEGAVINFSMETLFSGWERFVFDGQRNKCVVKYLNDYLQIFQGGATELNTEVLKKLVDLARRPFYSLMITDGEFSNYDAKNGVVMKALKQLNENGNELEVIYLNHPENSYLKELQRSAKVHFVKPAQVKAKILELAKAKLE